MTGAVAQIWRHPIKSHGRETLERVALIAGQTMPGDRVWAVAHDAAEITRDTSDWAVCANFSRGSKAPALMAINARLEGEVLTLTHPDRNPITFHPDERSDEARFLDWVRPLCPPDRAQPAFLFKVPGRGMTDTDFPSISLNSLASHRKVSEKLGREISPQRWRGNFALEGLEPWEEFDWIGKRLSLGSAVIEVRDRITRCLATSASTRTGVRDADTLGTLQSGWGHMDFGVYAVVLEGGEVATGDRIAVIA